jgi:hypothetical protein
VSGIAVTRKQEVRADPVDDRLSHVRVVLPEPFQVGKPADPHGGLVGAQLGAAAGHRAVGESQRPTAARSRTRAPSRPPPAAPRTSGD